MCGDTESNAVDVAMIAQCTDVLMEEGNRRGAATFTTQAAAAIVRACIRRGVIASVAIVVGIARVLMVHAVVRTSVVGLCTGQ